MNLDPAELEALITEYLSGADMDPARHGKLAEALRVDEAARDQFLRLADLHASLTVDESLWAAPAETAPSRAAPLHRLSWRIPRIAAGFALLACGLVVGFLSARVWATNSPSSRTIPPTPPRITLPLADAGFESGVTPDANEVPTRFGVWGGDFTRVVAGADQGIAPLEGQHMARFLRSDNARTPRGGDTKASQLWQVIDLAPYKQQLATGHAVAELTAAFARASTNSKAKFGVGLYAFNGDVADAQKLWDRHRFTELAAALKSEPPLDEPARWQHVTTQLALPRQASFLIVEIRVIDYTAGKKEYVEFPGHYVDAVQLRLSESP